MSERLIFLKCNSPCTLLLKGLDTRFPQRPSSAASAGPVPCRTPLASSLSLPRPPAPSLPTWPCLHFPVFALAFSVSPTWTICSLPVCSGLERQLSSGWPCTPRRPEVLPAGHLSQELPALTWRTVLRCGCFGVFVSEQNCAPSPPGEVLEGDGPASVLPVWPVSAT